MWRNEDCRELTASSINHNANIQLFFEIIKFWSNFFQKSVIFRRKEEIRTPVLTVRDRNSVTQHFPFIYHRSGALRSRPLNYFSICWTKRNRTADTSEFIVALYHWVIVLRAKPIEDHTPVHVFMLFQCFAWLRLRESNPVSRGYEPLMVFSTSVKSTICSSTQPRYIVLKTFKEICFLHACFLQWFLYIFSQAPSHFPSPIKKKRSLPPISLGNFLCILRVSYRFP